MSACAGSETGSTPTGGARATDAPAKAVICREFLKRGACRHGERCRFSHVVDGGNVAAEAPAPGGAPDPNEVRYDEADGPFSYAEFVEYYGDAAPERWARGGKTKEALAREARASANASARAPAGDAGPKASKQPCFEFQKHGLCSKGDRCRFSHEAAAGAAAPGTARPAGDAAYSGEERRVSEALRRDLLHKQRTSREYAELLQKREKLPAYQMRAEIVDAIARHQIVVISGDTGCGKTTQVPQLVLDAEILRGAGARART